MQFYENVDRHWRLFAYTKKGMLFSVNLTTATEDSNGVVLQQTLAFRAPQRLERQVREEKRDALVRLLWELGYEIREGNRVYLGTFDGKSAKFLDTTAVAFLRDFVILAMLKGHFMGNKGYSLPGQREELDAGRAPRLGHDGRNRQIPLSLRFRALQRDRQCLLCGATPETGAKLHVDHREPFSLGGRTVEDNLQVLCGDCNIGKGNRSSVDFRPQKAK